MTIEEMERIFTLCGSGSAAARMIGRDYGYLSLCRNGKLAMSHKTADALRALPPVMEWLEQGGGEVEIRRHKGGRPCSRSTMTVEELERILEMFGGTRATARLIGKSHSYLSLCLRGKRPISEGLAHALRSLQHPQ